MGLDLKEIRNKWFSGSNSEALETLRAYDGTNPILAKIYQSMILFQFGESHEALEVSNDAKSAAKANKDALNDFIATTVYGWLISFQGQFKQALLRFTEAETLLLSLDENQRVKARDWNGISNLVRGFCLYFGGQKSNARDYIENGIEILKKSSHNWFKAVGYYYYSWIEIFDKKFDNAENTIIKSLELFTELGNYTWRAFSINIKSIIAHQQDQLERALEYSKECLEISEREDNFWGCSFATYWIWQHYVKLNQIEQALEFFMLKKNQYIQEDHIGGLSAIYPRIAVIHMLNGNSDLAVQNYLQKIEVDNLHRHELDLIWSLQRIADIFRGKGKYEIAFEQYEKALEILTRHERKDLFGDVLLHYGKTHLINGDLSKARKRLSKGLIAFEEIGDVWKVGETLNLLGEIYLLEGRIDHALDSFNRSVRIYESIDISIYPSNIRNWSLAIVLLGKIYQYQGKYQQSIQNYQKGLTYFEEIHDDISIAQIKFYLITVYLEMEDLETSKLLLKELEMMIEKPHHPLIMLYTKISQASILKNSPRMMQKAQAQTIYRDILNIGENTFEITVLALLDFSDLLIGELRSFGESEVMDELNLLFSKLFELAKDKRSIELTIRGIIMQSRLALLEFNFDTSQKHLDHALELAKSSGLKNLIKEIEIEKEKFLKQVGNWGKSARSGISLEERLKKFEIENYLSKISRLIPNLNSDIDD